MRKIYAALAGVVLGLACNVNAQTATLGSFNAVAMPVQSIGEVSAQPDSIVQVAAESQGLEQVAPEDVPAYGTFWWVLPGGSAVPTPFPPQDLTAPIYQIADGQFLADQTYGQIGVNPRRLGSHTAAAVSVAGAVAAQANAVVNLINQVQDAQFHQEFRMAMGFDMDEEDSGGGMTADDLTSSAPDYGTNLWIAQPAIASGYLTGIGTNTEADVSYEIQSRTNLLQSDWQSEGFILGSEATNWTPLSVPQLGRTNLFIRLKSWATDGSGLPIWWQLQYFGTTGIDPNALDSAGDGWTIYQKYQMGLNPNVFYTPPAPQNLTVKYNGNTGAAILNWLPSPGAVTNYLVQKYDWDTGDTTSFNVSAAINSFADNVSGDAPFDLEYEGDTIYVDYSVQAQYAGGNSASANVSLESAHPPVSLVAGPQGSAFIAISTLPLGTASLLLTRIDEGAEFYGYGDSSLNTNFVISISTGTNGLYPIPSNLLAPPSDSYGYAYYSWWVQTLNVSNGATSVSQQISTRYSGYNASDTAYRLVPPYIDGRAALKDNVRFLLRAASSSTPFALNNQGVGQVAQTNYVCAGFYHCDVAAIYNIFYDQPVYDPLVPLENNFRYSNLVFSLSDMDTNGFLNTGVMEQYFISYPNFGFTNTPKYTFDIASAVSNGNNTTFSSVLTTNDTRWLMNGDGVIQGNGSQAGIVGTMTNIYGLRLSSVELTYTLTNQLYWGSYQTGDSTPVPYNANGNGAYNGYIYNEYDELQQPVFQLFSYYFARPNIDPMPEQNNSYFSHYSGTTNFAVTNQTPLMIVSAGQSMQVAGYAKLAILNGYTNRFAYLGQYFDQAYKITNGVATTTTTGVLSPYGNFFSTEPGQVALVTMPDVDTGARGTCTVYSVSLQLDANHDGNMDLSFSGTDATSGDYPYTFWVNNNFDRSTPDEDDATNYEDDAQAAGCPAAPNITTPDCDYSNRLANGYIYRAIPTKRDLEDFSRLWVCGVTSNLLAALPSGSTVTLSWGDVGSPDSSNPTIDLFTAADANGGMGYLTNETVATQQTNAISCPYIGRLAPGGSIQLNASQFANNWAGDHFIWCGVNTGIGWLTMTIADGNGNALGQTTSYLQILDIKQMYERWTVGDNPNIAPTNTAHLATEALPAGISAFRYSSSQNTNTPYILLVHGWNMEPWNKDRWAETAFKRLYWQGYQGRFGEFRWPTTYLDSSGNSYVDDAILASIYDPGEYNAWQSSDGLLNLLTTLNATYGNNLYLLAHSMGNVVAGEALRKAAQQGLGRLVNTYVASQAAVPGHCYDSTLTGNDLLDFSSGFYGPTTANIYNNWLATNSAAAGTIVNFYNTNDYALSSSHWQLDEKVKPDSVVGINPPYGYNGSPSDNPPLQNGFYSTFIGPFQNVLYLGNANSVSNRYEITAYAAEPRSKAVGATPDVSAIAGNIYLGRVTNPKIWPSDPNNYSAHFWHSAEFRGDNPQMQGYWSELLSLEAFGLK